MYGGAMGLVFGLLSDRPAGSITSGTSTGAVKEITQAEFETVVIQSARPVLVDFYAPWCGPCKALAPVVERMAGEFEGRIEVVKLNVDNAPQLAARYEIRGVPTLMIFKNGQKQDAIVGMVSAGALRERLQPFAGGSVAAAELASIREAVQGSQ
jgi:thioredoxin 1